MLVATSVLLSTIALAPDASTTRPKIGIGVEGELAPPLPADVGPVQVAIPSLSFTLEFRRHWGLQLLAGGAWASSTTDRPIETRTRQLGIHTSVRALFWPLRWERVRVGIVAQAGYRGAVGGEDAEGQTRDLRRHGFAVAAGLRPEFFVVPRLSLHTQLGVAYVFEDDNTTQTTQSIRFAGQVLGQAGITVWF